LFSTSCSSFSFLSSFSPGLNSKTQNPTSPTPLHLIQNPNFFFLLSISFSSPNHNPQTNHPQNTVPLLLFLLPPASIQTHNILIVSTNLTTFLPNPKLYSYVLSLKSLSLSLSLSHTHTEFLADYFSCWVADHGDAVMGGGGVLSFNSLMVFSYWVPELGAAGWLPPRALVYMKMNLVSFRECSKQNTHTHTHTHTNQKCNVLKNVSTCQSWEKVCLSTEFLDWCIQLLWLEQ
jgi:hypothetical protein